MARIVSEDEKRRLDKIEMIEARRGIVRRSSEGARDGAREDSERSGRFSNLLDKPISLGGSDSEAGGLSKIWNKFMKKKDEDETDEELEHKRQQGENVW